MTRTHNHSPQGTTKDKHLQRSGLRDPRGLPKKHGAGQHNWGHDGSELADFAEENEAGSLRQPFYEDEKLPDKQHPMNTKMTGPKVQVVDSDIVEKLKEQTQS
ncbi:hypothetical protein HK102_007875 [Quaeritorhiza haematococci]|nr:hypothetical protein HK102_007875 [Quaeritorhiza haematococci]